MKRNREHFDLEPDADGFALTWTRDRMTWHLYTQDTSTEPLTTFAWGRTLEDVGEVYDHEETFEGDITQSDVAMSDRQLRLLGMPNRLVFQQMVKRLRVLARNKNRAALRRNPGPASRARAESHPPRGKRERLVITTSHDGWPVRNLVWWDARHSHVLTSYPRHSRAGASAWFEWGTVDPRSKLDIPEWDAVEGAANIQFDVLRVDPELDADALRRMGVSHYLMLQRMIARLRVLAQRKAVRANPVTPTKRRKQSSRTLAEAMSKGWRMPIGEYYTVLEAEPYYDKIIAGTFADGESTISLHFPKGLPDAVARKLRDAGFHGQMQGGRDSTEWLFYKDYGDV